MEAVIPIFPLPIAVVPGQQVTLHIFESKYKEMVKEILAESENAESNNERHFGITYAGPEGLASMGCTVVIKKVLRRYKDGRYDLLAEGVDRFRLESLIDGKSYQQGKVRYIRNLKGRLTLKQKRHFATLHKKMCVVIGVRNVFVSDESVEAFPSAASLQLEAYQCQTLLELASERDRLIWLTEMYSTIINRVQGGREAHPSINFEDPGLSQIH